MTEREPYTPSLAAIRTWYGIDRAMYGEDQEFERGIEEFDRALRKHDANLIESLADELVHKGIFAPDEGYLDTYEPSHVAWLREKARVRREGVS